MLEEEDYENPNNNHNGEEGNESDDDKTMKRQLKIMLNKKEPGQ